MAYPRTRELHSKKRKDPKYRVACKCGHEMRVCPHHFGRMCRCTKCAFPIYVTYDNVTPPVGPNAEGLPRVFSEQDTPVHWQKGDLLMERYEVRGTLGEGGMGIVYKVYHRGWGKMLAVKSPKSSLLPDKGWIEVFERECETWINLLQHPNLVECYYVRRMGGIPRVFVEYVPGENLSEAVTNGHLYRGGYREALPRILDIAIQFARGLHHAHVQGVVHQDVKPTNVLLAEDGTAKITDFGLARAFTLEDPLSDAHRLRRSDPAGGSPVYRSPDVKLGGLITPEIDIWSWGVSMLELFVGGVFWERGDEAPDVLAKVIAHGPRLDTIPPIPKSLADLLARCFEHDVVDRPRDMQFIADTLEEIYFEEIGIPYDREIPAVSEASPDMLNNRAVSLLDLDKAVESETIWWDLLKSTPDHREARFNYHLHLWRTGRLTDTQMVYKTSKMHKENPDEWSLSYYLARVLMERGESETAIDVLQAISNDDEYKREIAFALAMAQNLKTHDKRQVWICAEAEGTTAVALSSDGWRAMSGHTDGALRVWEVSSGTCTAVLEGHTAGITGIALCDREKVLVSCSEDGTLLVWDPASAKCKQVLSGHEGSVRCVSISADGQSILSGGADGTLRLWNAGTGECLQTFEGHTDVVQAVEISRDGELALSGGADCTARLWDVSTGECRAALEGLAHRVRAVSLSADKSIALCTTGTALFVWDLKTSSITKRFKGHSAEISSVCLAEDSRYALTATRKGTVKIWDIESGQCIRSLQGHAPAGLSRDGRFAVFTGSGGALNVWSVNIHERPFFAPFILCQDFDTEDPFDRLD